MKAGITQKLFLSILTTTSVALLCMLLIMGWSISRGFLRYLNAMDQDKLKEAAAILEQAYAEKENWNFLKDNPWFFIALPPHGHHDSSPKGERGLSRERYFQQGNSTTQRGERRTSDGPFVILDERRKPLWGNPSGVKDINLMPVIHNNTTIGYIGLMPRQLLSPQQIHFLIQQKTALMLAALSMVLVVMVFALPLSTRLVRPVSAMTAATRDLASGKYTIRVPVSSSDELGQLARDFNAMALALEKNEKARRQWVADISHELRTPLSILRGEIEALLEGVRTTTPDAVRSLHSEALRLQRLVEDLYQLALSDLGTLTYHKDELDLSEALRDSVESHRAELGRKGISLSTDFPQRMELRVFADRERLSQLFDNLLDNSLKYTDPGGELIVRLVCHDRWATIYFADSIPGVPDEALERLFDRLFRVEASRSRASGGSGLGLAICRNIVEAHEGSISAHPSPLGGVMIRVALPLTGSCA